MEMTYSGAMVMPCGYTMIAADEMEYLEGGGTVKVSIRANTMQQILKQGAARAASYVCNLLGVGAILKNVASMAAKLVCDYVFANVWSPKAITKTFSAWYLPNAVISF